MAFRHLIITLSILITLNVLQSKSIQCNYEAWPPSELNRVDEVEVNLDLPAEQRWKQVIHERKELILGFVKEIDKIIYKQMPLLEHIERHLKNYIRSYLLPLFPEDYAKEIWGISRALDIHETYIIILNVIYDLCTFCTSVIQHDPINNTMVHLHNLDYTPDQLIHYFPGYRLLFHDYLQRLFLSVNFTSQGKTVFRSISYAGSVGVLTGMRPSGLAISINARFDENEPNMLKRMSSVSKSDTFPTFCARDALQNSSIDYKAAVKILSTTQLTSPVYFSVSGTKSDEACVLARSTKKVDRWDIKPKSNVLRERFLVQGNSDRKTLSYFLDNQVNRAYYCVINSSKNSSVTANLYNALSTSGVSDPSTLYTAIMAANSNYFVAYRRNFTKNNFSNRSK